MAGVPICDIAKCGQHGVYWLKMSSSGRVQFPLCRRHAEPYREPTFRLVHIEDFEE